MPALDVGVEEVNARAEKDRGDGSLGEQEGLGFLEKRVAGGGIARTKCTIGST